MRAGRVGFACAVALAAALLLLRGQRPAVAQDQAPIVRPWAVTASRYHFDPPRIEVFQDDLVKIDLRTDDIAHSMTIDAYRIAKRVSPGQSVTFEFRADRPVITKTRRSRSISGTSHARTAFNAELAETAEPGIFSACSAASALIVVVQRLLANASAAAMRSAIGGWL